MTENRRRKGRPRSLPASGKEECSDDTIPPSKLTKVSDGDVSRGFHEEFDEVSLLEPYGQQDGNSDQIIPYSSSSSSQPSAPYAPSPSPSCRVQEARCGCWKNIEKWMLSSKSNFRISI